MPHELDESPVLSYRLSLEEVPIKENGVEDESRFGEFDDLVLAPGDLQKTLKLCNLSSWLSPLLSLQFPSSLFLLLCPIDASLAGKP